ncbi:hypothetical protein ES703_111044 [subsurface metagenome]
MSYINPILVNIKKGVVIKSEKIDQHYYLVLDLPKLGVKVFEYVKGNINELKDFPNDFEEAKQRACQVLGAYLTYDVGLITKEQLNDTLKKIQEKKI